MNAGYKHPFGVAIVTNNRCPPLLNEISEAWLRRGIPCYVITNARPEEFSADVMSSMRALGETCEYVLVGGDDLLPVGKWGPWVGNRGSIQAVRTLDVEGRRWFDWACWKDGGGLLGLQPYEEPETPQTYISGNSQVWSPEAREVAAWSGGFGSINDVLGCRDAQAKGIRLLPPPADGPIVIHLERRYFAGIVTAKGSAP